MSCRGCGRVCSCAITAGSGVQVTGHGTAGNPYVISSTGGDGEPLEVGCGLDGAGTAASPLTAKPAAGQEVWPWTCAAGDTSTLKCDPTTGELWTPPEHAVQVNSVAQTTILSPVGPIGFTGNSPAQPIVEGAWVEVGWGVDELDYKCRRYSCIIRVDATIDVSFDEEASFEVGWLLYYQGQPANIWHSLFGRKLMVGQAPDRRVWTGGTTEFFMNIEPEDTFPATIQYSPAIWVVAGEVTVNRWIDRGGSLAVTQIDTL